VYCHSAAAEADGVPLMVYFVDWESRFFRGGIFGHHLVITFRDFFTRINWLFGSMLEIYCVQGSDAMGILFSSDS
jgi:hypothetical protein